MIRRNSNGNGQRNQQQCKKVKLVIKWNGREWRMEWTMMIMIGINGKEIKRTELSERD